MVFLLMSIESERCFSFDSDHAHVPFSLIITSSYLLDFPDYDSFVRQPVSIRGLVVMETVLALYIVFILSLRGNVH